MADYELDDDSQRKLESSLPDSSSPKKIDSGPLTLITKRKRRLTGWRLIAFMRFWEAFDYKHGKAEAADSWLDVPDLQDIVDQIIFAATVEADKRPALIQRNSTPKMAQGWLTARRWEDEAYQPKQTNGARKSGPTLTDQERSRIETEKFNAHMERLGKGHLKIGVDIS